MMRYIIANWKMNMSAADIAKWFDGFLPDQNQDDATTKDKEIIIAPSFPYLGLISGLVKTGTENKIRLAAQDISTSGKGPHTGETGAFQIADFCTYCIVGHSERAESREIVLTKRDICLANKIIPIICFINEQEASNYYKPGVFLVWEDPANISVNGKYRARATGDIQKGIGTIRNSVGNKCPVIYGGSVNRENVMDLAQIKELDGILVGNASTDPKHFCDIVRIF
jgi:triosephosphate isomerase (TIM)